MMGRSLRALLSGLGEELSALDHAGTLRSLTLASGVDVASNDYLGLAADKRHRSRIAAAVAAMAASNTPIAAPASRLLRGTIRSHCALEARVADFKGAEAALLFASGYQANIGLLGALIQPSDRVLSDALNHASLIDGIRSSRACTEILPHADLAALEVALQRPWPGGRTWVVVESLYSMDGDVLALDRIVDLAEGHGALVIVDDAHATGLFGDRGSGLVEHFGVADRIVASTTTFGKALAASGAAVSGSRRLIDYLVNRARPFIFSTAVPPLLVAAIEAGLDAVAAEPGRRVRTLRAAERLRTSLRRIGLEVPGGPGPIVPVVLGDNRHTLAIAAELQAAGFDARAVRPPTVAAGSSRIRFSIHADHDDATIDRLVAATAQALGVAAAVETLTGTP